MNELFCIYFIFILYFLCAALVITFIYYVTGKTFWSTYSSLCIIKCFNTQFKKCCKFFSRNMDGGKNAASAFHKWIHFRQQATIFQSCLPRQGLYLTLSLSWHQCASPMFSYTLIQSYGYIQYNKLFAVTLDSTVQSRT